MGAKAEGTNVIDDIATEGATDFSGEVDESVLVEETLVEGRERGVSPLREVDTVGITDEVVVEVMDIDANLDTTVEVVLSFPRDLESSPTVANLVSVSPRRNLSMSLELNESVEKVGTYPARGSTYIPVSVTSTFFSGTEGVTSLFSVVGGEEDCSFVVVVPNVRPPLGMVVEGEGRVEGGGRVEGEGREWSSLLKNKTKIDR